MEQSIFNTEEREFIMERIKKLKPDQQAVWGKMTVSQMLHHCIQPMEVGLGNLQIPRRFIGRLFGASVLRKTLRHGSNQFKKNLPTDQKFVVKNDPDFEVSKQKLLETIDAFSKLDQKLLISKVHPFFGKMDYHSWGRLQFVHLNHHLIQFDV